MTAPIETQVGWISEIHDRKYQLGQGYEMTRTLRWKKERLKFEHTLQIIAYAGNRVTDVRVHVDRWDGSQWQRVVTVHADELMEAPSYACWDVANGARREECIDWLDEAGNAALVLATELL